MKAKQIMALIKRKTFLFCITAYPLLIFLALIISKKKDWINLYPEYYGATVLLICSFVILCFSLEVLIKTFTYRMQGDKLKLRQREGIHITEIKEINHGH